MFNFLKKKPEMVKYGKKGFARARMSFNKKGERQMEIEGEKYPSRGFPKTFVINGPLDKLKDMLKETLFNQAMKCVPYMIPDEQQCEPVRELARVFDMMVERQHPTDKPLQKKWRSAKIILCHLANEDDAYRYQIQFFLQNLNMKKIRLNKQDLYYFRAKNFDIDGKKEW